MPIHAYIVPMCIDCASDAICGRNENEQTMFATRKDIHIYAYSYIENSKLNETFETPIRCTLNSSTGLHVLNEAAVDVCEFTQPYDALKSNESSNTSFTSDCVLKRTAFGLVFVRISTQAVVLWRVKRFQFIGCVWVQINVQLKAYSEWMRKNEKNWN